MNKSNWSLIGIGIFISILFSPKTTSAQCSLICNPSGQISLDVNCFAEVTPDDILEGSNTCIGPLTVELYDPNGDLLPNSPFIDGDYVGQTLSVKVIDAATGNYCDGSIDVRDYLAPIVTCSDVDLLCNASTHPDDIGYATVSDNCDTAPVLSYTDVINNPMCDASSVLTITRTWTATDASGNIATPCVQTITLLRPVLADIVFPDNKDDVESPALDCGNPDLSPTNTGYPNLNNIDLIDGDICEIWVMHTDSDPLPTCENSYTILRTWTINNECTNEAVSDIQVIKITDQEGPIINCPDDFTISASSTNCSALVPIPMASASDNCSTDSNISIIIKNENGTTIPANSTVFLETGIHIFTYKAIDDCGNFSECDLIITVDDGANPVAICNSYTTVALSNDGITLAPANVFDDGSYDNCGPITFLARRMDNPNCPGNDATLFETTVPFYCCDIGDTIMVEMMIEDAVNRLSNSCMVEVFVQDQLNPEIICPPDTILDCSNQILDPTVTGAPIATDNCTVASVTYVDSVDVNVCNVGMIFRTWTVTDQEGQSALCLQKITLIDTIPPEITFPESIDNAECGDSDDLSITGEPIIDDECGSFGVGHEDDLLLFDNGCVRKIIRVWTVYDWCNGLEYVGVQVIKEYDTQPPVFSSMPADMTVECDAVPPMDNITATDLCNNGAIVTTSESITPGACPDEYLIFRKWVTEDNCGNADSISQQITVVDTTPPSIIGMAPDTLLNCDAVIPNPILTATDNCDPDVDFVMTEVQIDGACEEEFMLIRTWTATDNCGNQSQLIQNLSFQDTVAPLLFGIPNDESVECDMIPDPPTITATDNCDQDVSIAFNETIQDGICADNYIITRTWTATDNCGNQTSESQTINVSDTEAPVLSGVPMDMTVECGMIPTAPTVTATDNCATVVVVVFEESTVNGDCPEDITVTRTWTATDNCGNTVSASQVITSSDTEAPVLSGVPMDMTVECGMISTAPTVTATDNCATVVVVFEESTVNGDCPEDITVTRTWTATDNCGNTVSASQVITSSDTEAPVLSGVPMDMTVECGMIPTAPTVTATDNCATVVVVFEESTVNGDCPEDITVTRTWTATDNCGNTVSASQVITSSDTEAPVLSGVPMDMTVECGMIPTAPTVTATDNCATVVVVFEESTVNGDCPEDITVTRTWTATDNCGNTVSATQVITSSDTEAPVLSGVPMDMTVECGMIPTAPTVTASDNCATVVVVFEESTVNGDCPEDITVTRTWTATDNCGNTVSATQVITSSDTEAPVLSGVPMDMTVECGMIPTAPTVTASDNCATVVVVFEESTVNGDCPEDITVTRIWTATDNCGNTVSATQVITSSDTEAPVLSGVPMDMTVECGMIPTAPTVTASDNCATVVVVFEESTVNGDCPEDITVTRTWTATDNCGNTVSATQVITSSDTEAPVLTDLPADMTVQCDAIPMAPDATATDNCDDDVDLVFEEIITEQNCENEFVLLWIWTATDNCGNMTADTASIEVIDDTAPVLSGVPPNITVECTMIPDPPFPTAVDNCDDDPEVLFDEFSTDPSCSDSYQIFRTWTAIDNCQNQSIRTQIITLFDNTAPVFTITPDDITAECSAIPPPAFVAAEDACFNGESFVITETTTAGPCTHTYTLNRTWTVTDSCGNSDDFTQEISVEDTTPPFLACPNDITFNIQSVGVCEFLYGMAPTTFDNCDMVLDLDYSIDFGNDGTVDSVGMLSGFPFLLIAFPIGENTITFNSTDDCGNTSSCSTSVDVFDLVPPAFFCNPQSVVLSSTDSTGFVVPSAFLLDPFLECCLDTLLIGDLDDPTIRLDTLFVDYDDFLAQPPTGTDVTVYAIDCYGNESFCGTKVFIFPPMAPPGYSSISGEITTEENESIENIEVYLDGGMSEETMTEEDGVYEFDNAPEGFGYYVQPFNNENPVNGVSTWDVILLQKHLLQLDLLDSPYKMIAADVNRSGFISTLDMVQLRQLILGIIPTFQSNTSWRFLDANFVFPDPGNPFDSTFPEFCSIENLASGINDMSFVGVKIGDLNNSAETNVEADADSRNLNTFAFQTEEQVLQTEEFFILPIKAKQFKDILGFQFSMQYDPDLLDFIGINSGVLNHFDSNNIGTSFENQGLLTCSWSSVEPISSDPEEVFFELKFKSKISANLSDLLSLNSVYTKAELYKNDGTVSDLELEFTSFPEVALAFELFQNRPNPFKQETIIGFLLKESGQAILSVYDASGKLVWQNENNYTKGFHEVAIRKEELEGSGLYFYQLKTASGIANKRMILVE